MERKIEVLAFYDGEFKDGKGKKADPIKIIELAGRTCYKSLNKITKDSAKKFVKTILKNGHESVIEHSWITFLIKGFDKTWTMHNVSQVLIDNGLLRVTEREDESYLISGNIRMFRDY